MQLPQQRHDGKLRSASRAAILGVFHAFGDLRHAKQRQSRDDSPAGGGLERLDLFVELLRRSRRGGDVGRFRRACQDTLKVLGWIRRFNASSGWAISTSIRRGRGRRRSSESP